MKWVLGIIINAVLFMALAGFLKESIYIEVFGRHWMQVLFIRF